LEKIVPLSSIFQQLAYTFNLIHNLTIAKGEAACSRAVP
jgi:hypothetical protein